MMADAYPGMPAVLMKRALQDNGQQACSMSSGEKLTSNEAAQIVRSAQAAIKYPANGQLSGDWKAGESLVSDGANMRVREGRVETAKQNGALCTNCHALDPKEVNPGSLGRVGRLRCSARVSAGGGPVHPPKIYNAWATYPCSRMPRLGHNGNLTPEQIVHVVAYPVDPQSPGNAN
jgi:sulfur-oxidizing protein SoxX